MSRPFGCHVPHLNEIKENGALKETQRVELTDHEEPNAQRGSFYKHSLSDQGFKHQWGAESDHNTLWNKKSCELLWLL